MEDFSDDDSVFIEKDLVFKLKGLGNYNIIDQPSVAQEVPQLKTLMLNSVSNIIIKNNAIFHDLVHNNIANTEDTLSLPRTLEDELISTFWIQVNDEKKGSLWSRFIKGTLEEYFNSAF